MWLNISFAEVINAGDSEVKKANVIEELICYPMPPKAFESLIGHQNVTQGYLVTLCPQDYTRDM